MITLIKNTNKKLILTIKIDNNFNLFLVINDDDIINIGTIFDFNYSKLKHEIEYLNEYYSVFNWKDTNDNFIYIFRYLKDLQINKEILRKLKLMKIYEK